MWLIETLCELVPLGVGKIGFWIFRGVFYGGLYLVFLRRIRAQPASVGDAFSGFRGEFAQLLLAGVVSSVLSGIGWAITFQDPTTKLLSNHWVTLHNDGNPAGYTPILVMDAWEHAFVPDYKPTERSKYIEAYLKNLDWRTCEARLVK